MSDPLTYLDLPATIRGQKGDAIGDAIGDGICRGSVAGQVVNEEVSINLVIREV